MLRVSKKNGKLQNFDVEKIKKRITSQTTGLIVNNEQIIDTIIRGINNEIKTTDLDDFLYETIAYMTPKYPDSLLLAGKLLAKSIQKNKVKFSETISNLFNYQHPILKRHSPLVSETVYNVVKQYKDLLDETIQNDRDLNFDYFGLKTLMRGYLLKINDTIVETPQYMYMRVSIGIHGFNINKVIETYHLLSQGYFTHATPTLFNAGTPKPQMSSCFLVQMRDDSIEGIYDTQKICAMISKYAGGIGLSVHNIRSLSSYIAGTNGKSNGLVPMLRVYNETARYVDQGNNNKLKSRRRKKKRIICNLFRTMAFRYI